MITIMTTVYNRAYVIERLYQSLLQQTVNNFEWLLIDDGSTDNLKELYDRWLKDEKAFEITYVYRENGGKHRAWNTGVHYAKGDYIFVVDSDDYLVKNSIEKVSEWIQQIDCNKKFAGVSGNRGTYKNNSIQLLGQYPKDKKYIDATNLQRYYKKLGGDKAEIYRTEILKKYLFPEFEDEKFCTEGAVFGRIAHDGYKIRWFPDIIYICEYLEDGLMNNNFYDRTKYFKGYTYTVKHSAKYEQFPINYLEIGHFRKEALKKEISEKEGAELIDVSLFQYKMAAMISTLNQLRNRIRKKKENEN